MRSVGHQRPGGCATLGEGGGPPWRGAVAVYGGDGTVMEVGAGLLNSGIPELISRLVRGHPIRKLREVRPFLFVGGQHLKRGMPELATWGISAVVNMRDEFDDRTSGVAPVRYLHLPVVDNTSPTLEQLKRGVEFIERERKLGGKVYVHCQAGVGRAPAMAAAYLVASGEPIEESWEELRDIRPCIRPRRSQRARIREFAQDGAALNT